jgi:serralysin
MSDSLPSSAQLATVAYMTGVNTAGSLVADSYANWTGETPATYSFADGGSQKWFDNSAGNTRGTSSAAGTPAGIVTYAFDPSVTWTTTEKQAFITSLTVWSDEANIGFQQVASSGSADLLLTLSQTYATQFISAPELVGVDALGGTLLADSLTPSWPGGEQAVITFNTSGYYGQLGTFGDESYGYTSLVHEAGHLVGLGHPGPYNEGSTAVAAQVQAGVYDSRQWSVMSYIDAGDTSATYFTQEPVTGTDWNETVTTVGSTTTTVTSSGTFTNSGTSYESYVAAPETPMMLDILAAQELYGAPSVTALDGGQIFGFNCNITDASEPLFDFSQNTDPVITLFDTGQNNTIDISGYTMDCTIDLNPGHFSSVAGLTNNVGIAFGTTIDTAVGGVSGNDRFIVNANPDTILAGSGTNTVVFGADRAQYRVANNGTVVTVGNTATGVTDTLYGDIGTLEFADTSVAANPVPCFVRGTRILAHVGPACLQPVPVEHLQVGDRVITCRFGHLASAAVIWTGHRRIRCAQHPNPHDVHPVRIRANAFDLRMPSRDLWLSPDHAVFTDGVLIPVKHLVNGSSIAQIAVADVEYWHVELGRHDVVLAEGLPAETYLDTGNRLGLRNGTLPVSARPVFSMQEACAPLLQEGTQVVAVKQRLAERAGAADAPPILTLSVAAGGRTLPPRILAPGLWRYRVPPGARSLDLHSPAWIPAACIAASLDRRALGVRLFEVMIDRSHLALESRGLSGFHPVEATSEGACRWTTGAGRISLPAGARAITLRVGDGAVALAAIRPLFPPIPRHRSQPCCVRAASPHTVPGRPA